MPPNIGDPAPSFRASTHLGDAVSLEDFRGRRLALYFYPMDDTPGCTAQACSLRDGGEQLRAAGIAVLGVSAQGAASHQRFVDKHRLDFPLLIDADHRIAAAYGALGTGPIRWLRSRLGFYRRLTFLIDEDGRIADIIEQPDTRHHAEEVLRRFQVKAL